MSEKFRQDMPPPGGYNEFNWRRTYPRTLFKPRIILPAFAAIATYGYFQGHMQKRQIIQEKFEDVDIVSAMQPFLLAERDREWLKIVKRNRDLENEVMKDVPGWKTGTFFGEPVYFTLGDKWFDPSNYEMLAHIPEWRIDEENWWAWHSQYTAPKFYDKYLEKLLPEWIYRRIW